MSEEPPQSSFLEKIKNIFLVTDKKNNNIQSGDEKIEEIIQNVIDIKDSVVSEIMIPRINISFISESDDIKKIMLVLNDTKHSRYPVFSADNKNVLGVLHVKDLLNVLGLKEEKFNLKKILRDVKFVPETKKVTSLLEEFKKDKAHLAIVLDEYGSVEGLITIEDILEEIVGEIEDEFYEESESKIITINENEYIVSSFIEKEKFEDFFQTNLDCPEVETLGGFILKEVGHLPKVGESLRHENLELIITSADQRKIKKITVRKID